MSVIDDRLQNIPESQRNELERIRKLVRQVVPDAEEVITYAMPGLKYKGKYLIAFEAFKDHMSIFPGAAAVNSHEQELTDYIHSKGTVQFTLEHPLSDSLVKSLVTARKNEILSI